MTTTPAHVLAQTIRRIAESDKPTLKDAWEDLLGAELGAIEFGLRHAEFFAIHNEVVHLIDTLPLVKTRERFKKHAPAWWNALVMPIQQWNAGGTVPLVIDDAELDALDSMADLLEALGVGIERPSADSVEQFRQQIHSWHSLVQDPDFGLHNNTVQQIMQQLQHILYLLDTVDTFGAGRIAYETEAVIGKLAIQTPRVPPSFRQKWKQGVGGLLQALMMFYGAMEFGPVAIESASEAIVETVQEIEDAVDAVRSDAPPSKEQ